jgi:hypothetical protein
VCCLFSLEDSRLDMFLMASVPGMTNERTPFPGEPFVFPSYGNVGSPFDPSPSSPVNSFSPSSIAMSSSVSSSSPSERSAASNPVDKKNKKRKNKKNKNKKGSKPPTTARHVGKPPVTDNHDGGVDDAKITQTTHYPKYPCKLCKGSHLLKDFPHLSKVIEAWSTCPRQPMLSTSKQHVDDLLSTSQDTIGKKKSRVKFSCMLCKGIHQNHPFPCMDEASKLLENMIVSQPQLPVVYHKLTLNPPVFDGMINPSSVNMVDHVVNLVTSLVEPFDKVVDLIPSSVDPTLSLESVT